MTTGEATGTIEPQTVLMGIYNELSDWEVGYATAHINKAEWQKAPGRYRVRTVGATTKPVTTQGGMRIVPDIAIADVDPVDHAMLILPGVDDFDPVMGKLARRFLDAGVPVAAICGATLGLAAEGLLDDRAHTSNAPEYLGFAAEYRGGERYVDEPAVTDQGMITAGGTAPVEFAREIFVALDLYSPEVLEAWFGLYSTGEAHWFAALMAAAPAAG